MPASPNPTVLTTFIVIACVSLAAYIACLAYTIICWPQLASRFRRYAIACITLMTFGMATQIFYYWMSRAWKTNCLLPLKLQYGIWYLGFLVFNHYQLRKISAITNASTAVHVALFSLLSVRLVSYVLNLVELKNQHLWDQAICIGSLPYTYVYLEHLSSILFEIGLCIQFYIYVRQTNTCKVSISAFLSTVIDFETVSFLFYFMMEFVFIMVYSWTFVHWLSLCQIAYASLPVCCFVANIWYFDHNMKQEVKLRESVANSNVNEHLANARISMIKEHNRIVGDRSSVVQPRLDFDPEM